ncbi:uncharacterized protein LOC126235087 [Schistocerca nitens]|uniref:uncharacterized protein LOC126235087 n=1 Tax=Schistocerca nitens TaxID=7011 RepID=UPI0021180C17|nr:uncharacterized protein LOC126235087 [Schistocerca nitens]
MKAITLCLCTSWTALLFVHELLADGEVSLCTEEGLFPRSDHCRLLILCLKSKTQGSQFKEYLLSCPYGLNFNHFMMTCYDFKQECALEKGHGVNQKLAKAWSLTLPNESESCRGAKAPFCTDEERLTICHPFSKKVLGYVNCKEKYSKWKCHNKSHLIERNRANFLTKLTD